MNIKRGLSIVAAMSITFVGINMSYKRNADQAYITAKAELKTSDMYDSPYTSEQISEMFSYYISENPVSNRNAEYYNTQNSGYALLDLNGDNKSELVVTICDDDGSQIVDSIYSINNDELTMLWIGDIRFYNWLCEGNYICSHYSVNTGNGFSIYRLSSNEMLEEVANVEINYESGSRRILYNGSEITEAEYDSIVEQYQAVGLETKQLKLVASSSDFEFDAETGTITKYIGSDNIVSIPSQIDGVTITSIGDRAFNDCNGITSLIIPDSVVSIGESAFMGCYGLVSIKLPDSIKSIGDAAFCYCKGLTSINIPNSVTEINFKTFLDCSRLKTVTIPGSVKSIGREAFEGCTNLINVNIPDSVISIGGWAFNSCDKLTNITIPKSVTKIDRYSFGFTGYIENPSKISGFTIYGYNDSATYNYAVEHGFTFISLDEGNINGDVNSDGILNSVDASAILTYYAVLMTEQTPTMKFDTSVADYNKDGVINSIDASAILTYYAISMTNK